MNDTRPPFTPQLTPRDCCWTSSVGLPSPILLTLLRGTSTEELAETGTKPLDFKLECVKAIHSFNMESTALTYGFVTLAVAVFVSRWLFPPKSTVCACLIVHLRRNNVIAISYHTYRL